MKNNIEPKLSFNKYANLYDSYSFLQKKVNCKLYKLANKEIKKSKIILDIGCGTGCFGCFIPKFGKKLVQADISFNMCKISANKNNNDATVNMDFNLPPFKENSFDLIYSSLMIHWLKDIEVFFQNVYSLLKPEKYFFISTVGPQNLKELKNSFRAIDDHDHINSYNCTKYYLKVAKKAGFKDIKIKCKTEKLYFKDINNLLATIKKIGSIKNRAQTRKGIYSKSFINTLESHYRKYYFGKRGYIMTWDIIYISGRK